MEPRIIKIDISDITYMSELILGIKDAKDLIRPSLCSGFDGRFSSEVKNLTQINLRSLFIP